MGQVGCLHYLNICCPFYLFTLLSIARPYMLACFEPWFGLQKSSFTSSPGLLLSNTKITDNYCYITCTYLSYLPLVCSQVTHCFRIAICSALRCSLLLSEGARMFQYTASIEMIVVWSLIGAVGFFCFMLIAVVILFIS